MEVLCLTDVKEVMEYWGNHEHCTRRFDSHFAALSCYPSQRSVVAKRSKCPSMRGKQPETGITLSFIDDRFNKY
jgi:hypothetical protein